MGLMDAFKKLRGSLDTPAVVATESGVEFNIDALMSSVEGASIASLWRHQPHLRTVVDFMAQQVGRVPLHVYRSNGDVNERVRGSSLGRLLKTPNPDQTGAELIYALVHTMALYDDALLVVAPSEDSFEMRVIPPTWIARKSKPSAFTVDKFYLTNGEELPAKNVCRFHGWTPGDPTVGTSPVETLRLMLEEQHSARRFRKQLWKRSGRFGGFLTRPKDAPAWDNAARGRFDRMWHAFTGDDGARAGDTPLLEDGMEYTTNRVASKEDQWLESVKASLEMCAQVYHINPTMVGMLENANYSNVREFRRALFGDSLGWTIKRIEDRFNAFLLPLLGADDEEFVEFNVEAMLRGSFEEQAAVLSAAVGGPWQTRNEARRLFNMPPIDGGDTVILPLNLGTAGGEGEPGDSPEDFLKKVNSVGMLIRSGFDPKGALAQAGLPAIEHLGLVPVTVQRPPAEAEAEQDATKALEHFRVRQAEIVRSKIAGGLPNWWDADRWDRELTEDLVKAGMHEHLAFSYARNANAAAFEEYTTEASEVAS